MLRQPRIRSVFAAGTAAGLGLLLYGLGRYTGSTSSPGEYLAFGCLAGVLVIGAGFIGIVLSRARSNPRAAASAVGLRLGVALAAIWIFAILVMHLAIPNPAKGGSLGVAIAGAAMVATGILSSIAGFRQTMRERSVNAGLLVGLLAGLISGLLSFVCVLGMVYGFMDYLLQYPKELHDFSQSGEHDLRSWFFWEELSGAIGYFLLELVLATTAAAIGSLVAGFLLRNKPGEWARRLG